MARPRKRLTSAHLPPRCGQLRHGLEGARRRMRSPRGGALLSPWGAGRGDGGRARARRRMAARRTAYPPLGLQVAQLDLKSTSPFPPPLFLVFGLLLLGVPVVVTCPSPAGRGRRGGSPAALIRLRPGAVPKQRVGARRRADRRGGGRPNEKRRASRTRRPCLATPCRAVPRRAMPCHAVASTRTAQSRVSSRRVTEPIGLCLWLSRSRHDGMGSPRREPPSLASNPRDDFGGIFFCCGDHRALGSVYSDRGG